VLQKLLSGALFCKHECSAGGTQAETYAGARLCAVHGILTSIFWRCVQVVAQSLAGTFHSPREGSSPVESHPRGTCRCLPLGSRSPWKCTRHNGTTALQEIQPYDTVVLSPGMYKQRVLCDKPVKLISQSEWDRKCTSEDAPDARSLTSQSVVFWQERAPAILVNAEAACLHNVAVRVEGASHEYSCVAYGPHARCVPAAWLSQAPCACSSALCRPTHAFTLSADENGPSAQCRI
jgi:hypothetical protein